MKQMAEKVAPRGGAPFKGGAQTFIFKGTNGRWKETLSADELALYEEKVSRLLTLECRGHHANRQWPELHLDRE